MDANNEDIIEGEFVNPEDMADLPPDSMSKESAIFIDTSGQKIVHPQKYRVRKRTIAERERDFVFIADLYLKGFTQYEIVEQLNAARSYSLSRNQIFKDIQAIYQRWELAYVTATQKLKMRELAKLDKLENEYWNAWERSQQDYVEVRQDKVRDRVAKKGRKEGGELADSFERVKTLTKKEQRVGDVRFLEGVERCVFQRCKILGLEAAKNVNINWRKQAAEAGLNPDEVVSELEQQFIAAALAGSGSSGSLGSGSETD